MGMIMMKMMRMKMARMSKKRLMGMKRQMEM
jgi:hypothetical protein